MLKSLDIKNYRNLKELTMSSLSKVNLITGKNNTGKSTVLEAIAIYATKGELSLIYQLLGERGENFKVTDLNRNPTETNIKTLSSLFSDRVVSFEKKDAITIGNFEDSLFGQQRSSERTISIRFIKYYDEIQRDTQGSIMRKRTLFDDKEILSDLTNFKVGLEIRVGKDSYVLPLDEERPNRYYTFKGFGFNESMQFIRTRSIDKETNGKLWDNVTLTEKEQFVIDALKIIEPSTERIAFIEENSRERTAVIKLSSQQSVLPLRSMGDGINRILTIILALVNSDNGYLLIDEFENGLHHTVQEQLWKIIFELSQRLNVQVFATTHSEDCIIGFENVLSNQINTSLGKLIRLDNIDGVIKQVEFDANELRIATDYNIEIR